MNLEYLVIHCTDTPANMQVTKDLIIQWHINERGWSRLGYSDMIHQDGRLENLTPFDQDNEVSYNEMTWGVKGVNAKARHIVYVGGKGGDTRTPQQREALEIYCHYTVLRHPQILVAGHNQFSAKLCPNFNVPSWAGLVGIPKKNIYYGRISA
jgi:N-acetylmuramoyl-L-alanine amidase